MLLHMVQQAQQFVPSQTGGEEQAGEGLSPVSRMQRDAVRMLGPWAPESSLGLRAWDPCKK